MTHTYRFKMMLVASSLAGAGVLFTNSAMAADLTIASWGGAYQEAQSKAVFQPAAKALGINLKELTYSGMSDIRLQVQTGAVSMDIVTSGAGSAARAGNENLLEPLDYSVIDISNFYPGMASKYCVGGDVFSNVFAWNTDKYGDGPNSWADFWDVEKFPGKRAYRGTVAGALEPALMADGVPPGQVYEVLRQEGGIERAINKIRELKPHIAVWWSSGAQQAQLMKDNEVDMTTGWNGRFDDIKKDGAKVAYTFNQATMANDCFAIPRGAPNKDLAMKFLAEVSKPQYQAELSKYITYGPTNKLAYENDLIDPERAALLPTSPDNAKIQNVEDTDWYIEFEEKASALYHDMILE